MTLLRTLLRTLAGSIAASCALIAAAYAGPCADDIARMEVRINMKLDALAAAGPSGTQDATAYGKHLQPTPGTLATAEEKLRELSKTKADTVRAAMDRARKADASGDNSACVQALAEVDRELGR
jgi:hypothetical protein